MGQFLRAEDRQREPVASSCCKVVGESIRALGMRSDHDLVGGELRERIGDRLHGICVADAAAGMRARTLEPVHARIRPLLSPATGAVVVGEPVTQARVERRRDDQHLGVVHLHASRRVECDHEDVHLDTCLSPVVLRACACVVLISASLD